MFIKAVANGLTEYFEFCDENMTDEEILEFFKEELEMQLAANVKTMDQLKIASEIVVEKVNHPGDEYAKASVYHGHGSEEFIGNKCNELLRQISEFQKDK